MPEIGSSAERAALRNAEKLEARMEKRVREMAEGFGRLPKEGISSSLQKVKNEREAFRDVVSRGSTEIAQQLVEAEKSRAQQLLEADDE